MKTLYIITLAFVLIFGFACYQLGKYQGQQSKSNEIYFTWNDDEESIPPDGSLIKIEFTDENQVFIGPNN